MLYIADRILGSFGKECNCPYCGRAGARAFWRIAKCRNPNCRRFNVEYAQRFERRKQTGQGFPSPNWEASAPAQPESPARIKTRDASKGL